MGFPYSFTRQTFTEKVSYTTKETTEMMKELDHRGPSFKELTV